MGKPLDDMFEKKAADDQPGGSPFKAPLGAGSVGQYAAYGALTPFVGPTMASMVGPGVEKMLSPKSQESIEHETVQELFDPSHEAELQRIRTQAMMSDFMSNDPIISNYDQDEVTGVYNHISQLAPRAALQPALMRGLLRKMLQQQDTMEAFDVDQLVKIEKGLRDVNEPVERTVSPYAQIWPEANK